MLTRSPQIQRLLDQVRHMARIDRPVLLQGESGTEKERLARCIHDASNRADSPFVRVGCAALPESRWDTELFGQMTGEGAGEWRPGKLDLAAGGTLFLDECADMPPSVQTKLLLLLESGSFRITGSQKERTVDVRIIAGTARDLDELQRRGYFREDLYRKLATMHLIIPPLRDRKEDIEMLTGEILARLTEPGGTPFVLTPDAMAAILLYEWPGNVQELEGALRQAVLLAGTGRRIDLSHLPAEVTVCLQPTPSKQLLKRYTRSAELFMIRWALSVSDGDRTRAAKLLGLSRAAIYKKLRLYPEFQAKS